MIETVTIEVPATRLRCPCGQTTTPDQNADRALRRALRAGWKVTSFTGGCVCPRCASRSCNHKEVSSVGVVEKTQ